MGILDILLILVIGSFVFFKLIGSSIEKAGKVPNIPQSPEESSSYDDYPEDEMRPSVVVPEVVQSLEEESSPSAVRPTSQRATPNLRPSDEKVEDEMAGVMPSVKNVSKKMTIDKKKLVIYSEILKPKYME